MWKFSKDLRFTKDHHCVICRCIFFCFWCAFASGNAKSASRSLVLLVWHAGAGFMSILADYLFSNALFSTRRSFHSMAVLLHFYLCIHVSGSLGLIRLRMILIGVAVNAMFTGLSQGLLSFWKCNRPSSIMSGISVTTSTLTMKKWNDVEIILLYGSIGLLLSLARLFMVQPSRRLKGSNLKQSRFQVNLARLVISLVAVFLASVATAVAQVCLLSSDLLFPILVGFISWLRP